MRVMIYFKVSELQNIIEDLDSLFMNNRKLNGYFNLLYFFLEIAFISHLIASVWLSLGYSEHNNSWFKLKDLGISYK